MDELIGRPYDPVSWNCATLVADHFGLEIEAGEEWGPRFLVKMRRHATPIDHPANGALVVMRNADRSLHVGVLKGAFVLHADESFGTCKTPLALIKRQFISVRFYEWHS